MWLLVAAACRPAEHEGRPIAPVMSWWFADWLERENRANQEGTDALLAALPLEPDDTVADLGCGTGFHARRIARRVRRVYCVDLQAQMLARAGERARAEGIGNLELVPGAVDRVPLPAGSVDLLLMADVYHELSEPDAVLTSVREVLAPGGLAAVVEFRLEGDSARFVEPEHRMSAAQVVREWTGAGFRVAGRFDSLPAQHLLLFSTDGSR